jgi:hypothetical protein
MVTNIKHLFGFSLLKCLMTGTSCVGASAAARPTSCSGASSSCSCKTTHRQHYDFKQFLE